MQFGENWVYQKGHRIKDGYYASTDVEFILADFDMYVDHWTKLADFQNLTVRTASFSLKDAQKYRDKIRSKAIANAKDKAQNMAAVLGAEIGQVLAVTEQSGSGREPVVYARGLQSASLEAGGGGGQAAAPGEIQIEAYVRVVFALVPGSGGKNGD